MELSPPDPVEFVAPVEDPDCPLCAMPEAVRLMLMLESRAAGADLVLRGKHGELHRFAGHTSKDLTSALSDMRRAAKEADARGGPSGLEGDPQG